LKDNAQTIAEETVTDKDSQLDQLQQDLVSIIGQKTAEMHLIAILFDYTASELATFFDTIFSSPDPTVYLTPTDVKEATYLVRTSRHIFHPIVDAYEFESNFRRKRSRMPKTYFLKATATLTTGDRADIFALRFIGKSKADTKSVNQTITRNSSFKSFGLSLSTVIDRLRTRKLNDIIDSGEQNTGR
jgi:hypothetical protein